MQKKGAHARVLIGILACLLLYGCSKRNGVTFEGDISHANGKYLTISKLQRTEVVFLDSVEIKDGRFSITIPAENDEPAFYLLSIGERNALTSLASRGEQVQINADGLDLIRSYTATGAHDAELMSELDSQMRLFADSVNHLYELYTSDLDEDLHAQIEECYLQIKQHHTQYLNNFILKNSESLSTITAFYEKYNNGTFFNEISDFNTLKSIFNNLKKAHPNNENVLFLQERVEEISKQQKR